MRTTASGSVTSKVVDGSGPATEPAPFGAGEAVALHTPPFGQVLRLLHEAHRHLANRSEQRSSEMARGELDGISAASVAAVECAVHLVRAADRMCCCIVDADPVAEAMDALAAARAAVIASTFAVRASADACRKE